MSNTLTTTGFTQDSFDAFLAARDEPGWLTDLRTDAWQQFCDQPMPSHRDEEWMRTDIRLFRLDRFAPPSLSDDADLSASLPEPLPESLLSVNIELGGHTTSLDSHPRSADLADQWARQGVLFGSLDTLVAEHSDLIKPHLLRKIVDPSIDKFSALQSAFWSGGTLLYVPEGVVVDQPLHTLSATSDGGVDLGRTLVILERGAQATLLSETASTTADAGGMHCGAIELSVGPEAHLRYVNLQNWGTGHWHFAHQRALVDAGARLQWTIGALGSRLAKVNQHVVLTGHDAEVQVNGVMFTEGRQHLSYHTLQHHQAPYCRSDLLYKAALQDQSRTVWRGMIKVDPDAQRTDAYQRNDNLMLSADARSDSIPGLEIEADDVRCTHGATAGRVDDLQVFYARSRGLTRREAVRMIVTGFFQQVFDRITIDSVRDALGHAIAHRIREYD